MLGLPSPVLMWGRFLSGTGGMCQVLWKPALAKSLWDGSFTLFAGPFLGSCLEPGQGLCKSHICFGAKLFLLVTLSLALFL